MAQDQPSLKKPDIGEPCNACGLCCLLQVCGTGSYVLRLVDKVGERAPGPCPALVRDGDRMICGLVLRPKDYINGGSAMKLREAVALLIGSGSGCDEAGDDRSPEVREKLKKIQKDYMQRVPATKINAAANLVFPNRK
ncbi:MAG: hypothetical protein AB7E80_16195 [Hyphomicrobiaceae bacterium]